MLTLEDFTGLIGVADEPKCPTRKAEAFSLLFDGGANAVAQGTYPVTHRTLGSFDLFVVPAAVGPRATFNTL